LTHTVHVQSRLPLSNDILLQLNTTVRWFHRFATDTAELL